MAANPPISDLFRYSGILPSTHGRLFAPGVAGNHTSTRLIPDDTLIMGEKLPEDPTSLSDDASRESAQPGRMRGSGARVGIFAPVKACAPGRRSAR